MAECLGTSPPRRQRSDSTGSLALWCFLSWLLTTSSLLLPGTTVCPPCDNEMKSEAIVEHLCASEFGKEERWRHGEASLGGAGQRGSCVGWILDHCVSLPALRAVWPAVRPVWPRRLRAAVVLPRGEASVPLDVSVGARRRPVGRDWTCPGRVRLLQPSAPGDQCSGRQDSGVLAAVSALLHCPGCGAERLSCPAWQNATWDEAPKRGIARRSSGAAGCEAPLLPSAPAASREPDGVGLESGDGAEVAVPVPWVCNLTLVFPCSCALAEMMRSVDPYSACNHEGANQLPPSPRLLVPLCFFLAKLCCSCQV